MKSFFKLFVIGSFMVGILGVQPLWAQETPQSIARYFYEKILETARNDFQRHLKLYVGYFEEDYETRLSPLAVETSRQAVILRIERIKDRIEITSSNNVKDILDAAIQDKKLFLTQTHLSAKKELENIASSAGTALDQFKQGLEQSPSIHHKHLLKETKTKMEDFIKKLDEMIEIPGIIYSPTLWAGQTPQSIANYFYRKLLEVTQKAFQEHLKLYEIFLNEKNYETMLSDTAPRTEVLIRSTRIGDRIIISESNTGTLLLNAIIDHKLILNPDNETLLLVELSKLGSSAYRTLDSFENQLRDSPHIHDKKLLLEVQKYMKDFIQKIDVILTQ